MTSKDDYIEEVIEASSKLGVKNGMRAMILLVRQIKITNPEATIDEVLDILEKTYGELYKEAVI